MNWDALGAMGEIVGAVAVVATLLYLAAQMRHSNRTSKAAVASDLMQKYNDFLTVVLANPEIGKLASRLTNPAFVPESDEEPDNAHSFANLLCNLWFSAQIAYEQGQIDERDYSFYQSDVEARLKKWPAALPYVRGVLEHYPGMEKFPIYAPIFDLGSEGAPPSNKTIESDA
jgi:hypothetical protein